MSTFTLPRKFKGIQGEDFAYQGVGKIDKDFDLNWNTFGGMVEFSVQETTVKTKKKNTMRIINGFR